MRLRTPGYAGLFGGLAGAASRDNTACTLIVQRIFLMTSPKTMVAQQAIISLAMRPRLALEFRVRSARARRIATGISPTSITRSASK